jgi:hypothetical protein
MIPNSLQHLESSAPRPVVVRIAGAAPIVANPAPAKIIPRRQT